LIDRTRPVILTTLDQHTKRKLTKTTTTSTI
jgi:hypothetical protein